MSVLGLFPYLRVGDANAAIGWYVSALGGVEVFRLTEPSGRVGQAELKLGSHVVMLSDEYPEMGILGPRSSGGSGMSLHLHVDDVDAWTSRAVASGARLLMEPTDQFYGERASKFVDPFGHEWILGSSIEEVAPEEMQRRFTAMFESPSE